jgi:uncharacterized protein (TIGR03067 family)
LADRRALSDSRPPPSPAWVAIKDGLGLLLGAGVPAGDGKKDRDRIQGVFRVLIYEDSGVSKDGGKDHLLSIKGDQFSIRMGGKTVLKGTFKLDPSKKPKQIDLKITEDAKGKSAGKTAQGIYQSLMDGLVVCTAEPGSKQRPTGFATTGTKRSLMTLLQQKP